MKIGLYKIGRDIAFIDKPTTKIYQPVMKAFRDFLQPEHDVSAMKTETHYDVLIVDTGVISDEKKLPQFKDFTSRLVFVDSDPYLTEKLPKDFMEAIDDVVVFNDREKIWFPDAKIHKLPVWTMLYTIVEQYANIENPLKDGLYYGSEEKDRLGEILEFVYRPDPKITYNLRLPSLGFDNWTTLDDYYFRLGRAYYTIMIEDLAYYLLQQTTVRYYEALLMWTMPLATPGFFTFNKQFPSVKNYTELTRIINTTDVYINYWKTLRNERAKFLAEYKQLPQLIKGIL